MQSVLYTANMNTSTKHPESISETSRIKTLSKNVGISMVLLFIALLAGSGATSSPNEALSSGDIAWGVISVIAFASLLWALYTTYRQADERLKIVHLKATSLAFMAVIFCLVSAQILHALDVVYLNLSVQVIVVGGILLWMSLLKSIERRSA